MQRGGGFFFHFDCLSLFLLTNISDIGAGSSDLVEQVFYAQGCSVYASFVYPFLTAASTFKSKAATWEQGSPKLKRKHISENLRLDSYCTVSTNSFL